ncbi:MAG: hypothetical protein ACRC9V_13560 [Aeromonas sp.]
MLASDMLILESGSGNGQWIKLYVFSSKDCTHPAYSETASSGVQAKCVSSKKILLTRLLRNGEFGGSDASKAKFFKMVDCKFSENWSGLIRVAMTG